MIYLIISGDVERLGKEHVHQETMEIIYYHLYIVYVMRILPNFIINRMFMSYIIPQRSCMCHYRGHAYVPTLYVTLNAITWLILH